MSLTHTLNKTILFIGLTLAFQSAFPLENVWTHNRNTDDERIDNIVRGDDVSVSLTDLDGYIFDNPAFANTAVEVHQGYSSNKKLYLRIGKWDIDDNSFAINWDAGDTNITPCTHCPEGNVPSVSLNNNGDILVISYNGAVGPVIDLGFMSLTSDENGKVSLFSSKTDVSSEIAYGGLYTKPRQSVSLNNNREFITAYILGDDLYFGTGRLTGSIDGSHDTRRIERITQAKLPNNPADFVSIGLNDNSDFISVFEKSSKLYVCTGKLINTGVFLLSDKKCPSLTDGRKPSVSINNKGLISLVYNRGDRTFHQTARLKEVASDLEWSNATVLFTGSAEQRPGTSINNENFITAISRDKNGVLRGKTGRVAADRLLVSEVGLNSNQWISEGSNHYTQELKLDPNQAYELSLFVLDGANIDNLTAKLAHSEDELVLFDGNNPAESGKYYTFMIEADNVNMDYETLTLSLLGRNSERTPEGLISHIALDRVRGLATPPWWQRQSPLSTKTLVSKEDGSKPLIWHLSAKTAIVPRGSIPPPRPFNKDQRVSLTAFVDKTDDQIYYYLNTQAISEAPQDLSHVEQIALKLPVPVAPPSSFVIAQHKLDYPNVAISHETVVVSYVSYDTNEAIVSLEYVYGTIQYSPKNKQFYIDWSDQYNQFLSEPGSYSTHNHISASMTTAKEIVFVASFNQSLYAKSGTIGIDPDSTLPFDNLANTNALQLINDTSSTGIRSASVALLADSRPEEMTGETRGIILVRKRNSGVNELYAHGLLVKFAYSPDDLVTNDIEFYQKPLKFDTGIYPMVTIVEQPIERDGKSWFPVINIHKDSSGRRNLLYTNYGELIAENTGAVNPITIMGDPEIANMATDVNAGFRLGVVENSMEALQGANVYSAISSTPDGNILLSQVCGLTLDESGLPVEANHICSQWAIFTNPNKPN